jgi:hypothetical protein
MYIHTEYAVSFKSLLANAFFPAYIKRGFDSDFPRILDILRHFGVVLPYFIRILAYFSTYVCILRKIQALYGCIRILRRIIRNTLTYIRYATATAYNWSNIRVCIMDPTLALGHPYFQPRRSSPDSLPLVVC